MSIHRFEPAEHRSTGESLDDAAFDAREWQLQERATREECDGAPASDDPALAQYRRVARALREPLPHAVPDDFAARVAARAEARRRTASRVEDVLTQLLLAALGIAGGVVAMRSGGTWLEEATARLPVQDLGLSLQWGVAIAACLGLSWGMEHLRRRTPHA